MTPYQVAWLDEADGSRGQSGRWATWIAPIITAILVIALGLTVFGLMNTDNPGDAPEQPVAAEPAR